MIVMDKKLNTIGRDLSFEYSRIAKHINENKYKLSKNFMINTLMEWPYLKGYITFKGVRDALRAYKP